MTFEWVIILLLGVTALSSFGTFMTFIWLLTQFWEE